MTTITKASTVITPTLVLGYEATATAQTVLHEIVGSAVPDVTLTADQSRAGTLQLLFAGSSAVTDAWAAFNALTTPGTFDLEDPDLPALDMTAIRDGDMSIVLSETRKAWIVSLGFREVTA